MAEPTRTRSVTATRTLGALALLVIGGVHYQQYRYAFYSSIPTIGPLFLLNFIAGTALGLVPEVDDAESAHLPGAIQLWPHRHGTDAMFMVLLRRG